MKIITRTDAQFVRQVQEEYYSQKIKEKDKPRIVKLPCYDKCRAAVQVFKPQVNDVIKLQCPKCAKFYYLAWSNVERHKWRQQ